MVWKPTDFSAKLKKAVDTFDRDGAAELCEGLIDHLRHEEAPYPLPHAKTVLDQLRRKRYFELMQRVADTLIQTGQDAPLIRCRYAQSQLDQSNLTAAISALEGVIGDTEEGSADNAEARGLLGRAYKQLYMDAADAGRARNRRYLEKAIRSYREVYDSDKAEYPWHGINTVALIRRAARDEVELENVASPRLTADSIAAEILAAVNGKHLDQKAKYWDFANAVEACVGLQDRQKRRDETLTWLSLYLQSDYTDAFELASSYRQLREVWQLRVDEPPGDRVLPALKSALLRCQGSEIEITRDEAAVGQLGELAKDAGFEKILGHDTFQSLKWFRLCMDRARAVGRVETRLGAPIGSGFLVRGGDLKPGLGDDPLFLTNAHVISDDSRISQSVRPQQAVLEFELWNGEAPEIEVAEVLWSSPPDDLDATLVRLRQPVGHLQPLPIASPEWKLDDKERAYIIGHPQGRKLSFSIHDNHLLDADDRLLHYRSPTAPGSSGSPVFNGQWELIGLHHAGLRHMPKLHGKEGTYPANEGILIQAIIERLKGVELD